MASTSLTPTAAHDLPLGGRSTIVALGLCWVPLAVGETLLGDLDALADVASVGGGSGRIAAAGLLHIASGVLLAYASAGLLARFRGRIAGRIGSVLMLVLSTCLGAFGMLHLLALETTSADLDPAAMDAFLGRLAAAPGWWAVPVGFVGLLGLPVVALTCLALARSGSVRWWGPAVVTAAALAHFVGGSGEIEIGGHWGVAAGLTIMAIDLTRSTQGTLPAPTHDRVPAES